MSDKKIDTSNGNALATQPKIVRDDVFLGHLLWLKKNKPAAYSMLEDWLSYSQDGSILLDRVDFARYREKNRVENGKKVKELSDESVKQSLASNWSTLINQLLKKLNAKLPSATTLEIIARNSDKSVYSNFKDGRSSASEIDIESEAKKAGLEPGKLADMLKMLGNL